MIRNFTLAALALACGAAFAQAPAGTLPRPAQESNPNASGGVAQARAGARNDAQVMGDHSAMDANRDGMVSQKEWNTYYNDMWRSMKADKSGHVPWADVNTRMMGGAGGPVGSAGKGGQAGGAQGGTPK